MSSRYELRLSISDPDYVDTLIIGLVRQGYDVYYNPDVNLVCCTITDDEIEKIKDPKKDNT